MIFIYIYLFNTFYIFLFNQNYFIALIFTGQSFYFHARYNARCTDVAYGELHLYIVHKNKASCFRRKREREHHAGIQWKMVVAGSTKCALGFC